MKQLTEQQIVDNWNKLIQLIENTFDGERKEKLLEMYKYFENRMSVAPASGKAAYHNAMVGGYVDTKENQKKKKFKTKKVSYKISKKIS